MYSFTLVSAALVLVSLTSASPLPKPASSSESGTRTFTVQQNGSKPVYKSGPIALANAYNKYKKAIPANIVSASSSAADGSVTTTPGLSTIPIVMMNLYD